MRIKVRFISVILALLMLCGCTGREQTTEQITQSDTDAETTAPETEYVPPESDIARELSFRCAPAYRERVTQRDGVAKYAGSVRLELEYTSSFYGHDSLINRDYLSYGTKFAQASCTTLPVPEGEAAGADLDGDGYDELIVFKDGKLSVYGFTMKRKKEQVFIASPPTNFSAELKGELHVGEGVSLRGSGDFDLDGYSDLLFTDDGYVYIYYGGENGFTMKSFRFVAEGTVRCGDVDGDGKCELIDITDRVKTYSAGDGGITPLTDNAPGIAPEDGLTDVFAADINQDGVTDIVFITQNGKKATVTSLFGRGDGRFGPYDEDNGNKNLYSTFVTDCIPVCMAFADITGDGCDDMAGAFTRAGSTKSYILYVTGEPAYDYSIYGMRVNGEYRIYSGCRWSDANYKNSDGDHVMLTTSKDGKTWKKYIEAPMFMLGCELGIDEWWSDNTLEPEVIYADGKYHMYWQCSYTTPKGNYGDKIGYASSDDGVHWERKTDEPVIVCDDPEVGFNHEEVLYVPDDPDGKPYWMYTGHFVKGAFRGYIRIRSAVPDRFDYSDREGTDGFSQIGNQLAYFTDDDGRRIFVRITFSDAAEEDGQKYWRPTLWLSDDGLKFVSSSGCTLAGVDVTDPRTENNRNMFFFGMITENGTGEIKRNEDGTYTIIYLATTCKTSVAPEIFSAEVGYGEMTFKPSKR